MNSSAQYSQSGITEITGKPGQVWSSFVIPAGGKASLRIVGDTLQGTTAINFGLETKEIYTRIQAIDTVEVVEGRIWWLLVLGLMTIFVGIGIVLLILFFFIKQKWIVVYSGSASLIIFHKDTNRAKQFSQNVLAVARQLNSSRLGTTHQLQDS